MIKVILLVLFTLLCAGCAGAKPADTVKFAVFADVQYCGEHAEANNRFYIRSKSLFAESVRQINRRKVDFTLNLGDTIDHKWENFPPVLAEMAKLESPLYSVLGNHDFSVPAPYKLQVSEKMGMPAPYYMFKYGKYRFLALNTNEISLYAWTENCGEYSSSCQIITEEYPDELKLGFNGGYSKAQLLWVDSQLSEATANGEEVIIFQHCPITLDGKSPGALNSQQLLEIIDGYPGRVRLCLSGHHHAGGAFSRNAAAFITVIGQVESAEPCFVIVEITPEKLTITGSGMAVPPQSLANAAVNDGCYELVVAQPEQK